MTNLTNIRKKKKCSNNYQRLIKKLWTTENRETNQCFEIKIGCDKPYDDYLKKKRNALKYQRWIKTLKLHTENSEANWSFVRKIRGDKSYENLKKIRYALNC